MELRSWYNGHRGTALVETAAVLPVLLLLFIGIFEFGRILMIQQALTNAAREGARAGAVKLDDTQALSSAQTVSQDYLTRTGVDLSRITINPTFSELDGTAALQLTILYDFSSTLHSWIPGIPETVGLRSRVVMRREA